MAERPEIGEQGERLYARLEPWATEDGEHGWSLRLFVGAIGEGHELVREVIEPPADTDLREWTKLFDVEQAPDWVLPWLAQLVGVRLRSDLTIEQKRDAIASPGGWGRGGLERLIAAVKETLTGTKFVSVVERQGDSFWRTLIRTRSNETPHRRENLCANPSFELNLDRWQLSAGSAGGFINASLTRENGWASSGSWSARVKGETTESTLSSIMVATTNDAASRIPVEEGKEYTLFGKLNVADQSLQRGTRSVIFWQDEDGVAKGTSSVEAETGTGIHTVGVTATAPAGATRARIGLGKFTAATGETIDFYVDDVMFGLSDRVGVWPNVVDYFDGDSPGAEWLGPPHNSVSRPHDWDATLRAARRVKRAAVVLTHEVADETLIDELAGNIDSLDGDIDSL